MVDKNTIGNIAAKVVRIVPGVSTYQGKEKLRDIDKRLRDQLASLLNQERDRIEEMKKRLTRSLALDPLDDLDRLTRKMHQLADTIKHAAYGWSPVFDQASVDNQRLESLYEFDTSLENALAATRGAVDRLTEALENNLDEAITAVDGSLSAMERTLQKRELLLKHV